MNHPYADIRTFDFRGLLQRDLIETARPWFDRHAARIAGLKTQAAARAYQREKRALIETVIGGIPARIHQSRLRRVRRFDPADRRPQVVGSSTHDGVTVERLVFQSAPGSYVTGLLHRPQAPVARRGRPAVVFVCGHSDLAKNYVAYLAVQHELAQNGFVVLAIDPHGQGERQFISPIAGRGSLVGSVGQHFVAGIRADLTGHNIARWFIADIMSAVDILEQVPEVDPRRIGITGTSGGGTQTAYAVALEPRFAAAAPSCYINDRQQYLESGQMHDHEQNFFRAVSAGVCHHDFLILAAPRPVVVLTTRGDFFPIEGARLSVARARHVYGLFKAGRNLELSVTEERHSYSNRNRHKAVDFFRKHLGPAGLIGRKPRLAEDYPALPLTDTHVTRTGQLVTDHPRISSLTTLVSSLPRLHRLPKPVGAPLAARRRRLIEATTHFWNLEARLSNPVTRPVDPRRYDWPDHRNPAVRDSFFFTEARAALFLRELVDPARVPTRTAPAADALVVLSPKEGFGALPDACWPLFRHLAMKGTPVLLVSPRGVGPNRTYSIAQNGDATPDALAATERTQILNYTQLGSPLAALQACDLAAAFGRPRSPLFEEYQHTRLHLAAVGAMALPAALGALFSPMKLASLRLADCFASLAAVVDGPFTPLAEDWNVFGLLQFADLPQLCALANADRTMLVNPLGADELPLASAVARRLFAMPYARCRGMHAARQLTVHCQRPPADLWLALVEDLL